MIYVLKNYLRLILMYFYQQSIHWPIKDIVTFADLEPYPCLSFEQGIYNSFYFAEEIHSTISHRKNIYVSDRATLFNLAIG